MSFANESHDDVDVKNRKHECLAAMRQKKFTSMRPLFPNPKLATPPSSLIKNEPPNSSDLRKVENPQISATSSLELTKDSFNLTDSRSSRPFPEVEIVSLLEEELPRYQLRADYLTEIGGCRQNYDFVIQTPVLEAQRGREVIEGLTSDQAEATLDYFVSCGDRLSQMTKTYHDVEAVTRLLQEKENDLELAAKIGQELLERNRRQDERVNGLEIQLASSSELITQLRHELIVKTDLLHVYTNDAIEEDISPIQDVRNVHDEIMQRKVYELEDENKRLHQEATEFAKEAYACEAKEDKLVTNAVKHLTEANVQINQLSEEFNVKSDESHRQKEEITHLLAQVYDLHAKVKKSAEENADMATQLGVYKETQDDLTLELSDFKEKYREVVDLLHDTQDDLKIVKRKTYPGVGEHKISGMFSSSNNSDANKKDGILSLQSEIHSSIRSSKKTSRKSSKMDSLATSDFSDSDFETASRPSSGRLRTSKRLKSTFETYKLATANKMHIGGMSSDSPIPFTNGYNPGLGSSYEGSSAIPYLPDDDIYSYTVSRDISQSPTAFMKLNDPSFNTSNTITVASAGNRQHLPSGFVRSDLGFGELRPPGETLPMTLGSVSAKLNSFGSESGFPLGMELGQVPISVHHGYQEESEDSEFAIPELGSEDTRSVPGLGSLDSNMLGSGLGELGSVPSGQGQLGSVPGGLGSVPGLDLGSGGGRRFHPGLGSGLGQLGSVPSGQGQLGSVPSSQGKLGSVPCGQEQLGFVPGFSDSGVMSSDFQDKRNLGDGMPDFSHYGESEGLTLNPGGSLSGSNSELEEALSKLTPQEVSRRRQMFNLPSNRYSFDLGSDGFESPGSLLGKPGFPFLPYGVQTPDSLMSTGSREWTGSSGYGAGWKLPDKLRIVKPLEGSLTLHNWQRLAMPSLGGIFEERRGVMMKGARNLTGGLVLDEIDQISDLEDDNNEDEADIAYRLKTGATILQENLTNTTDVTSAYGGHSRMSTSSLFNSRSHSRRDSISSSDDLLRMNYGKNYSTNIGLAHVLNERNIHGGSSLSLDQYSSMSDISRISRYGSVSEVASICSLTPSVIHSPNKDKNFSPTGTPLNSPARSKPGSRTESPSRRGSEVALDNPGFVLGFFASLRTALYGEQQKEVKTLLRKKKKQPIMASNKSRLGILERVQEVGPQRFLSPTPLRESSAEVDEKEMDELIDIRPGTLTISRGMATKLDPDMFGELRPPRDRPQQQGVVGEGVSGRGPGRIVSPGDKRPNLPSGYGVPGKTGTGALTRPDLGCVPVTTSSGDYSLRMKTRPSDENNSFIGTMTSMFFGRKGGLL